MATVRGGLTCEGQGDLELSAPMKLWEQGDCVAIAMQREKNDNDT